MKKNILYIAFLLICFSAFSQEKMFIHKTDKISLGALIDKTDSIYFNSDGSQVYFRIGDTLVNYSRTEIDSLSFGNNDTTIYVVYNGTVVSVLNPLAFEGVNVSVSGADVTIKQTGEIRDITYKLTGTTTDGMFKIYSEKRFNLVLNNVSIINNDGPAINIQSENKVFVKLADGTNNTITDGINYAAAPIKKSGNSEDQKAAFFSEGKLVFSGTGSLTVNGKGIDKHGICSDETIEFESGTITVASAAVDGIHTQEGMKFFGGTFNVKATGDAIDGGGGYLTISGGTITASVTTMDTKVLSCDSTIVISGGTLNFTVGGNQSKGIKAGQNISLLGGNITINTTGGVVLAVSGSGYEPTYCTAIKCDSTIFIDGATLAITCSGAAAKGISSDKNVIINSGTVTVTSSGTGSTYTNSTGVKDAYSSVCIDADVNLSILGGTVTTTSSGLGGKGIAADGNITFGTSSLIPTIKITTTGAKFLVSGTDYCHPKAVRGTGEVDIENGNITITSSDDGIHSDTKITFNDGSLTITTSYEGLESKYIYLNGGITNITATNDGINCTFSTVSGGTESNDNSCLYINGGTHTVNGTNGDAIDSNGNLVMNGGVMVANGPSSGPEEACDFNGSFNMNGGFFIGGGSNSNMTKSMSSTSLQRNLFITSASIISTSTFLHIQDASGNDLLSFKSPYGAYKFLYSSSSLNNGATYSIYTGGSYTGGTSTNGLYTGGTYSLTGATLKKSVTLSTIVTSVSF